MSPSSIFWTGVFVMMLFVGCSFRFRLLVVASRVLIWCCRCRQLLPGLSSMRQLMLSKIRIPVSLSCFGSNMS